jgi:DNA-binding GntR family transcriptional regulator
MLESEGLIVHLRNQGHFVARLDDSGLHQLYLLRKLLVTEIIGSLPRPTTDDVKSLRAANKVVAEAVAGVDVGRMVASNRQFHFLLYGMSPLDLLVRYLRNVWDLAAAFQATFMWLPERRQMVVAAHNSMIDAYERYDLKGLIRRTIEHSRQGEKVVGEFLHSAATIRGRQSDGEPAENAGALAMDRL